MEAVILLPSDDKTFAVRFADLSSGKMTPDIELTEEETAAVLEAFHPALVRTFEEMGLPAPPTWAEHLAEVGA